MLYPLAFMLIGATWSLKGIIAHDPAAPGVFAGFVRFAFVVCFFLANAKIVGGRKSFRVLLGVSLVVSVGLVYSLLFQGDVNFLEGAFGRFVALCYVFALFMKIFLQRRISILRAISPPPAQAS